MSLKIPDWFLRRFPLDAFPVFTIAVAVGIVAIPPLVVPAAPASLTFWTSIIAAVLSFFVSVGLIYVPMRRYLCEPDKAGTAPCGVALAASDDEERRECETRRLLHSVWLFVFSFGTGMTALTARVNATSITTASEALAELLPRFFVVWFLSILTMVATRVISRLDSLERMQLRLQKTLAETDSLLKRVKPELERIGAKALSAVGTAAEAVKLLDEYLKVQGLESQIQRHFQLPVTHFQLPVTPTKSFVDAGVKRLRLIKKTGAAALRAATMEDPCAVLFPDARRYLTSNVLLPALLPYLGDDTWRPGEGIAVIQDGSYLPYSRFIEAVFRELYRSRADFRLRFPDLSVEIFTTLSVPPRRFFNVLDGRSVSVLTGSNGLDQAATTAGWEAYRAVQAFVIAEGRDTRRLGLTRCFVTDPELSSWRNVELTEDKERALVLRSTLEAPNAAKEVLAKSTNAGDTDAFLRIKLDREDYIEALMSPLKVNRWGSNGAVTLGDTSIPFTTPRQDSFAYAIGIAPAELRPEDIETYGGSWRPLMLECLTRYLSWPERALTLAGRIRLPQDIFVVGVVRGEVERWHPKELNAAFIVTLETSEGATATTTSVLFPGGDAEVETRDGVKLTFDDISSDVSRILRGEEDAQHVRAEALIGQVDINRWMPWADSDAERQFLRLP